MKPGFRATYYCGRVLGDELRMFRCSSIVQVWEWHQGVQAIPGSDGSALQSVIVGRAVFKAPHIFVQESRPLWTCWWSAMLVLQEVPNITAGNKELHWCYHCSPRISTSRLIPQIFIDEDPKPLQAPVCDLGPKNVLVQSNCCQISWSLNPRLKKKTRARQPRLRGCKQSIAKLWNLEFAICNPQGRIGSSGQEREAGTISSCQSCSQKNSETCRDVEESQYLRFSHTAID